jgi:putative endopeptidase
MDRSVKPGDDFYRYAAGHWLRDNPVPADKTRWSGFEELRERNWHLIREILETVAADKKSAPGTPPRQVGDLFASAMDTNRIERLGHDPIEGDLKRIDRLEDVAQLVTLLADFHQADISGFFGAGVSPDAKNSSIYAFELNQGGLSLPDRDYYLKDDFAKQREAYRTHVSKMLTMIGEKEAEAAAHAGTVLEIETALARGSRTRVELRDPNKNYNKVTTSELIAKYPALTWPRYLAGNALSKTPYVIVGQPEFFDTLASLLKTRPMADWKVYLRWHLLRSTAPYLSRAFEDEQFAFYGKTLRGQEKQEPRWQRAAKTIDGAIGEAMGELYVAKHYPPSARERMNALIANLRDVFRDRLAKLEWMSPETKGKALTKFAKFTQKIGHPEKFRDYSRLKIERRDFLGNVRRAAIFESRRQLIRVGQPVDKSEWRMTPQTVNAYFNPLQNEIVFPAGILQPPFFDVAADDAVNYGAIGMVIGHEMTHGYDDEGRQFDAEGNLQEWWIETDAREFEARAEKLIEQYNGYEVLPGVHVNGKLTLGENIADLGGLSMAYEALQRALAKDPSRRKMIDGFTPEQRFFLSLAQLWRTNVRDEEARRLVTVDPHSPGQVRAVASHVNMQEFFDAFEIKEGAPMWRAPEKRTKIW